MFIGWGVYPVARKMPPTTRIPLFRSLLHWSHWPLLAAGSTVIATGALLGTIFGPIRSWEALLSTTYGHLWLTSLLIGIGTLLWGALVGYPYAMNVFRNYALIEQTNSGNAVAFNQAMRNIMMIEAVEIIGFIALLICMLAWR